MSTNPKDIKDHIRRNKKISPEETHQRPMEKRQIKELIKLFNFYSATRNIAKAYKSLNTLPVSEQNKLDKGPYFRALIDKDQIEMIQEIIEEGNAKDIEELTKQVNKVVEGIFIAKKVEQTKLIFSSTRKYRPPSKDRKQQKSVFSNIKNKVKATFRRSASIKPENTPPLSDKESFISSFSEKELFYFQLQEGLNKLENTDRSPEQPDKIESSNKLMDDISLTFPKHMDDQNNYSDTDTNSTDSSSYNNSPNLRR